MKKKRTQIIEDRLREPWDSIKHSTIWTIGASGKKENGYENIFGDSRKLSQHGKGIAHKYRKNRESFTGF